MFAVCSQRMGAITGRRLATAATPALSKAYTAPEGFKGRFDRDIFASLRGRDFLDMMDYTPDELKALLDAAHCLKVR